MTDGSCGPTSRSRSSSITEAVASTDLQAGRPGEIDRRGEIGAASGRCGGRPHDGRRPCVAASAGRVAAGVDAARLCAPPDCGDGCDGRELRQGRRRACIGAGVRGTGVAIGVGRRDRGRRRGRVPVAAGLVPFKLRPARRPSAAMLARSAFRRSPAAVGLEIAGICAAPPAGHAPTAGRRQAGPTPRRRGSPEQEQRHRPEDRAEHEPDALVPVEPAGRPRRSQPEPDGVGDQSDDGDEDRDQSTVPPGSGAWTSTSPRPRAASSARS